MIKVAVQPVQKQVTEGPGRWAVMGIEPERAVGVMYDFVRQATEYRQLTKLLEKLPSEPSVDATKKLLLCLAALVCGNAEGHTQFTARHCYRQDPPPACFAFWT